MVHDHANGRASIRQLDEFPRDADEFEERVERHEYADEGWTEYKSEARADPEEHPSYDEEELLDSETEISSTDTSSFEDSDAGSEVGGEQVDATEDGESSHESIAADEVSLC